jgi:hypothetical protein
MMILRSIPHGIRRPDCFAEKVVVGDDVVRSEQLHHRRFENVERTVRANLVIKIVQFIIKKDNLLPCWTEVMVLMTPLKDVYVSFFF